MTAEPLTITHVTVTPETPAAEPSRTQKDPRWVRPALVALLVATGVLYLWGLGRSGWANAFYSAAVQAGTESWKAFFFGSSDAANFITVDKTPASLWVMVISARLFGVNSWSILVPQALEGVAAVWLLYATVKRWFSPAAALLAGAIMAATPVAALMFRFNNPDALLVLLLVASVYATVRALETASTKWLALAGMFVGFGFLAKMLQALLVVPVLALVYLVAAPTPVRRRLVQLCLAGAAMVASAGWWIAIVELWPASSRPYIGGTQNNSILELTLGYNGLGRLTGDEVGSVGGNGGWGETGLTRLFDGEIGGQIAWLLPAALILLTAGVAVTWRAGRTDRTRAALGLWGGWLLITAAVFSFMAGIFHAYYTVALAPAIGGVVGIGATMLFQRRREPWAAGVLAATVAVTAIWAYVLLGRSADWQPWLRPTVLVAGLVAAAALLLGGVLPRRLTLVAAALAVATALAAPAGYSLSTAAAAHTGAIPSAGPAVAGGMGGPGGRGGFNGGAAPGAAAGGAGAGGAAAGGAPGGTNQGGTGGGRGQRGFQPGTGTGGGAGRGGGMGGLLDAVTPSAEVIDALRQNADQYTWVAATIGANNASGYQLATGEPVMAIGGFNGTDAAPSLEQFQQYVAAGRIHYYIGGSGFNSGSGSSYPQDIAAWVAANYPTVSVGGTTMYDLTDPTA